MGKAAIYNPYLDTLGGGEKYTLSFAKVLAEDLGYDVFIEWKDASIKEKLVNRFGIKLPDNIKFVESVNRGEGYDLIFWVSDGSIPTLRARMNILHFQVPFKNVNGRSLLNRMKLFRINKIICNSMFTKKVIDKEYKVSSTVLYPPVDVQLFKPKRKEKIICYIGRFSSLVQNKGHLFLIKAFKKLVNEKGFSDWKLILAGGVEVGVGDYLNRLRKVSQGSNVEIVESPEFTEITKIYGKSKFFWSAAGYGVDEEKNPEKVEHFGITLIEAMSSGATPIVCKIGGFREIIKNGENGYFFKNSAELVRITKKIGNEHKLFKEVSKKARLKSLNYSYDNFRENVKKITLNKN